MPAPLLHEVQLQRSKPTPGQSPLAPAKLEVAAQGFRLLDRAGEKETQLFPFTCVASATAPPPARNQGMDILELELMQKGQPWKLRIVCTSQKEVRKILEEYFLAAGKLGLALPAKKAKPGQQFQTAMNKLNAVMTVRNRPQGSPNSQQSMQSPQSQHPAMNKLHPGSAQNSPAAAHAAPKATPPPMARSPPPPTSKGWGAGWAEPPASPSPASASAGPIDFSAFRSDPAAAAAAPEHGDAAVIPPPPSVPPPPNTVTLHASPVPPAPGQSFTPSPGQMVPHSPQGPVKLPATFEVEVSSTASDKLARATVIVSSSGVEVRYTAPRAATDTLAFGHELQHHQVERGAGGVALEVLRVQRFEELFLATPHGEELCAALDTARAAWRREGAHSSPQLKALRSETRAAEERARAAEAAAAVAERQALDAEARATVAAEEVARVSSNLSHVMRVQQDMLLQVDTLMGAYKQEEQLQLMGGDHAGASTSGASLELYEARWSFVNHRGAKQGPYSLLALKEMVSKGQISSDVYIEDRYRGVSASLFCVLASATLKQSTSPASSPVRSLPASSPPPPHPRRSPLEGTSPRMMTSPPHATAFARGSPGTPPGVGYPGAKAQQLGSPGLSPTGGGGKLFNVSNAHPLMTEATWMVMDNKQQLQGPYSLRQLQAWMKGGYINPDVFVMHTNSNILKTTLVRALQGALNNEAEIHALSSVQEEEKCWSFSDKNGKLQGPYAIGVLRHLYAQGRVPPDTLVINVDQLGQPMRLEVLLNPHKSPTVTPTRA